MTKDNKNTKLVKLYIGWHKLPEDERQSTNVAQTIFDIDDTQLEGFSIQIDQFVSSFLEKSDEILFGSLATKDQEIAFMESLEAIKFPSIIRNGIFKYPEDISSLRGGNPVEAFKRLANKSLLEKLDHIDGHISQRSPHYNNHSLDNPNVVSAGNVIKSLMHDRDVIKKVDDIPSYHSEYKVNSPMYPYLLFKLLCSKEDNLLFKQRQSNLREELATPVAASDQDASVDVEPFVWQALSEMKSNVHGRNVDEVRKQLFTATALKIKTKTSIDMSMGQVKQKWDQSVTDSSKAILNFLMGQKEINPNLIPTAIMDPENIKVSDRAGPRIAFIEETEVDPGKGGTRKGPGSGSKPGWKPPTKG